MAFPCTGIYFDSSYVLKCYLNEPQAERVRALAGQVADKYSCRWGWVEFFSGIKRQTREGKIRREQEAEIFRVFQADELAGVWIWLPVDRTLLDTVCASLAGLLDPIQLRAGAAVHLACAREHGFSAVYSDDKHLLAAAPYSGLEGKNILT